jgi:hypothetical protein
MMRQVANAPDLPGNAMMWHCAITKQLQYVFNEICSNPPRSWQQHAACTWWHLHPTKQN